MAKLQHPTYLALYTKIIIIYVMASSRIEPIILLSKLTILILHYFITEF